jgi:hypothetical protein
MKLKFSLLTALLLVLLSIGSARAQSASATPSATPTAASPAATPASPLYSGVTRVYQIPPPYAQVVFATGTAGGAVSLILPQVAGFTTLLEGFDLSCAAPSASVSGTLSVTGIRGGATFQVAESVNEGTYLPVRQVPIAQASSSTPIAISLAAITGGAACSINAYYAFKD